MKLYLQLQSVGEQGSGVNKALLRVKKANWSAVLSSHTLEHYPGVGFRRPQSQATCQ